MKSKDIFKMGIKAGIHDPSYAKINCIAKMKFSCTRLSETLHCHASVHFQSPDKVLFTLLSIQPSFLVMQRKKIGILITKLSEISGT